MKVFLSYAKEDRAIVKDFYDYFKRIGLDPWMDQERLLPGQSWEIEIERALNEANVVILFLSPRSVKKRSFVTREANTAIKNLRYKHADDIYIIPVLIEACEVPKEISDRVQYISISEPAAKNKILSSIQRAAEQQEIPIISSEEHGPYQVFSQFLEEQKSGQPGYCISLSYPKFISETSPKAAESLTKFFEGRAIKELLNHRTKPWHKDADLYPEADEEFNLFNANGLWENFGIASASKKIISVYLNCSWYGAGAAHSNEYHKSLNFYVIDDKPYPFTLTDLFLNTDKALDIISHECRKSLKREYFNKVGEDISSNQYSHETFITKTAAILSNFETFTIANGNLTFYFPPYSIAAYAYGSFSADVSLHDLNEVLNTSNQSPLGDFT